MNRISQFLMFCWRKPEKFYQTEFSIPKEVVISTPTYGLLAAYYSNYRNYGTATREQK